MAVFVDRVTDEDTFGKLALEWDSLLAESGQDWLFLTWEWLFTWWRYFGSKGQLYLLCVRDSEKRLIGLAPLRIVRRGRTGGGGLRVLEWLGSGSPVWSDALDLIARRESEQAVREAIGNHLLARRDEWDAAWMTDCPEDSAGATALSMMLQSAGLSGTREACAVCPYLVLGDPWPVYDERAHRKFRDLKKYLRALEEAGAEFGVVKTPEVLDQALDALVRLNRERVLSKNGAPSLANDALCRFVQHISRTAFHGGWLRLYYVSIRQEFIALNLNFVHGSRVYGYLSGFDPAWQRRGVGTCLFRYAIHDSWEKGFKVYDFLRGDEAYKYRWASDERRSIALRVINHRGRYALFRTADFAERALKKMWRRAHGALQQSS